MLFELLFAAPENIGFNPPDGIEYLMFVAFFFFIFFWSLLKESDLPYRFFGTTRSEVHPSEETVTLQVIDDEGKSDWEAICATAIAQAKTGDHRAREWLMKNGVSLGGNNTTTSTKQDPQIVTDAIDALKTIGYKAGEARKVIDSLIKNREYDDVQELITEALTKKGV